MTPPRERSTFDIRDVRRWGVVPLVELPSVDAAVPVATTLRDAGLPCIEVALRTEAAIDGIAAIREACPSVVLGAGTVLDGEQLEAVIRIGVQFVVTPGFDPEIVDRCRAAGVAILPGVATPTEIALARRGGLSVLKLFPAASLGGVPYLKAIAAPFRDVMFVPTGGIDGSSLPDYLAVPQVLACGGSWVVPSSRLRAGDFEGIGRLVRDALATVRALRGPLAEDERRGDR